MAGFREFVTGEVLTAANVDDFLMKQTVMKFADAGARDTALGTAVAGGNALREGMVAYLDDTDEVQYFDGSVWGPVGAEPPAGIGSNVVQAVKTDTFTTSSATFGALTGMSVSITPSSLTSKVLVLIDLAANGTDGTRAVQVRLLRASTVLYVGDAAGSRIQAWVHSESGSADLPRLGGVYLDSPNTTSPVTYSLEIKSNSSGQVVYVNRTPTDTDSAFFARVASSITAIEVAG